jgi:hypothetical protein
LKRKKAFDTASPNPFNSASKIGSKLRIPVVNEDVNEDVETPYTGEKRRLWPTIKPFSPERTSQNGKLKLMPRDDMKLRVSGVQTQKISAASTPRLLTDSDSKT